MEEVFKTWKHIRFICIENSTRFDPIELDLSVVEEALKEYEIVLKKYVDLNLLDCNDEVGGYNRHFGKDRQLTQEEFVLLQRMLKE